MASRLQLHLLREGQSVWNLWRQQHPGRQPNLREADLSGLMLRRVNLRGARLGGSDLRHADLREADLSHADLCGAQLHGANLRRTTLSEARLSRAHLSGAQLRGARLQGADLSQAVLTGASCGNADLGGAELSEAVLDGANLNRADLSGAKLYAAQLRGASLVGAKLCDARMSGVNLTDACLDRADLSGADLSQAVLEQTACNRANLQEASLRNARLLGTRLMGANLNGCAVDGLIARNVKLHETTQLNLLITLPGSLTATTDYLETARFLELMLAHSRLRELLELVRTRFVLVLGQFTMRQARALDDLRAAMRERGYQPVTVDYKKMVNGEATEAVILLARIAGRLIADLPETAGVVSRIEKDRPDLPVIPFKPLLQALSNEQALSDHLPPLPEAARDLLSGSGGLDVMIGQAAGSGTRKSKR